MSLRDAFEFDYLDHMAQSGRELPLTKLKDAVAGHLAELADRAEALGQSIFNCCFSAGLLVVCALLLLLFANSPVWVIPAGMSGFALLSAGERLFTRRRAVADLEEFEERLGRANYLAVWTPTQSRLGKKLQVRILWREEARQSA